MKDEEKKFSVPSLSRVFEEMEALKNSSWNILKLLKKPSTSSRPKYHFAELLNRTRLKDRSNR